MGSTLIVDKIQGATTAGTVEMPAGSVIQTLGNSHTISSNITTSGTSFTTTGLTSPVITPKFASSKILVTCDVGMVYGEAAADGSMTSIFRSVQSGSYAAINVLTYDHFHESSGTANISPHMHHLLDTPTYTLGNNIRYQLFFKGQGVGNIHVYAGSMVHFTVSEIKQ
tara:strand:- start:494 stop:997 length:504 start_codon:yes stop_codon:yes gene_type:complete